jgi:hypothetical protein
MSHNPMDLVAGIPLPSFMFMRYAEFQFSTWNISVFTIYGLKAKCRFSVSVILCFKFYRK